MSNDGMAGKQQDLIDDIMKTLKAKMGAEFSRIEMAVPDENGNIKNKKFPMASDEGNVSFRTLPNVITKSSGVSGTNVTGTEALVSIIVDKTINFILENFEVAWHDRIETLETDFNTFLTNLLPAATALAAAPTMPPAACAPSAALFISSIMSVKGPARAGLSTVLKTLETAATMGTNIK